MKELFNIMKELRTKWINDDFFNYEYGLCIEFRQNEDMNENSYCKILGLNKKLKVIFQGNYEINTIMDRAKSILKSDLVIISADLFHRNEILNILGEFSRKEKCYAPIVVWGEGDILFFPKLRYQDSFWLDNILKSKFVDKKYYIVYANANKMVVI